jgi:hypothetical protein
MLIQNQKLILFFDPPHPLPLIINALGIETPKLQCPGHDSHPHHIQGQNTRGETSFGNGHSQSKLCSSQVHIDVRIENNGSASSLLAQEFACQAYV